MIALCRYSLGLPHNRLEKLQRNMELPIPASTQWQVIEESALTFEPVFAGLERQAAQGEVVHNDVEARSNQRLDPGVVTRLAVFGADLAAALLDYALHVLRRTAADLDAESSTIRVTTPGSRH